MKRRRESEPPVPGADDQAGKLSHTPLIAHDDDERPSREDMNYGSTIFTRPTVPLPVSCAAARRSPRARFLSPGWPMRPRARMAPRAALHVRWFPDA